MQILRYSDPDFTKGNAYVVEAKRQVFGAVAVDLLPGPSEILFVADRSGNPAWIAANLLSQAEHGKGSFLNRSFASARPEFNGARPDRATLATPCSSPA